MTTITTTTTPATMSSLALRDLINAARLEHGESKVENSHFLKRIEDELEGELGGTKTFRPAQGGTPMRYYELTRDQCTLVGMRESKGVRRTVLAKLKELEDKQATPALPENPVIAGLVTALYKVDELEREQNAIKERVLQLEAKGTTSPTEFYTVAGYATLKGIKMPTAQAITLGRKAGKLSRDNGIPIGKEPSAKYGTVNAYHVDVLEKLFQSI